MPEWREMTEQIEWWAKQSSQVAEKIWSADELETLPAGTKPMATHLWSPGGERVAKMKCSRWSTQRSSIKAWERAIVNHSFRKVTLEKFLRDEWGRVHMVFSVHIDIILNWTEWNPGSQVVKVMSAVPPQREVIWASGKTVRFNFIKKVSVFSPFQFQFRLCHLGTSCQKFTPAWHLCVKGLLKKYQILLLLFHHADPEPPTPPSQNNQPDDCSHFTEEEERKMTSQLHLKLGPVNHKIKSKNHHCDFDLEQWWNIINNMHVYMQVCMGGGGGGHCLCSLLYTFNYVSWCMSVLFFVYVCMLNTFWRHLPYC